MKKILFILSVTFLMSCNHKEIDPSINSGNDSIIPEDTLIKPAPTPTFISHP